MASLAFKIVNNIFIFVCINRNFRIQVDSLIFGSMENLVVLHVPVGPNFLGWLTAPMLIFKHQLQFKRTIAFTLNLRRNNG